LKIGVVGSSGNMGSFFARYFISKGFDVFGYDLNRRKIDGMLQTGSIGSLVNKSDVILVAVPMEKTLQVISHLPSVKEKKTLVEITSVKSGILEKILLKANMKGYELCSVHPLFGPYLKEGQKMKLAVVGEERKINLSWIFPDAEFVFFKDATEHDRAMAYILSLTHAICIAYSSLVRKYGKSDTLFKTCTPFSSVQTALSFSVLYQDEDLISQIQLRNPFSMEVLEQLMREITHFTRILSSKRAEAVKRYLKGIRSTQKYEGLEELKNVIYDAYQKIVSSFSFQ
jgi:prephenate dehydrogenase